MKALEKKNAFSTIKALVTSHVITPCSKVLIKTVSFHSAPNHSNFLNQMYFNILCIPALPAGH